MLQINHLTITHRKDLKVILEDFSLVLNDGDKAVIIGEEGNGKSTLMKWIYDPKLVEDYTESNGNRITGNERLGYLPQELMDTDKEKSVYEFFTDTEVFYDQTPKDLAKYAKEFHIANDFFYREQLMRTLSGGEKIKAQIIRLMMQQPTVLLFDEPSNDIDIETLEWLETFINNWPHIVLFISHDETLIENTANKIIHIEQLRKKTKSRYSISHMSYGQYREERSNQFEKQRQQAVSDRRDKRIREEKYQKIYQRVAHEQEMISRQDPGGARLLKKKMHAVKSMGRRFEREDENMTEFPEKEDAIFFKLGNETAAMPAGKTVLEYSLNELKTPDGEKILAKDIFLRIKGSKKICITGINGAGKTTLLGKMADELLQRTDITVGYMTQNYEELLDLHAIPVDFLDDTGDKTVRTNIRTYLGSLRYTADEMARPISELSGGQKAKLLLLKMSLSGANVLILDEPTRNFSPLSGPVIRKMLREFPGAILSISHDRKYIAEVCDTVYELTADGLRQKDMMENQK